MEMRGENTMARLKQGQQIKKTETIWVKKFLFHCEIHFKLGSTNFFSIW